MLLYIIIILFSNLSKYILRPAQMNHKFHINSGKAEVYRNETLWVFVERNASQLDFPLLNYHRNADDLNLKSTLQESLRDLLSNVQAGMRHRFFFLCLLISCHRAHLRHNTESVRLSCHLLCLLALPSLETSNHFCSPFSFPLNTFSINVGKIMVIPHPQTFVLKILYLIKGSSREFCNARKLCRVLDPHCSSFSLLDDLRPATQLF